MPVGREQPTVSIQVLRGLVHLVEEAGLAREELLRDEPSLDLDNHGARVPIRTCERILERAMALTDDEALGLHWAEQLSQRTFGPISYLSAHAPNLRQAFEVVSRFGAMFADEPFFALQESDDTATLLLPAQGERSLAVHRFTCELTLGGFVRITRSLWAGARFDDLCLSYPAPHYAAEYSRVFKQPVSFGQPFTGLLIDRALLDAPSPYRDDALSASIQVLAEQRLVHASSHAPNALRVLTLLEQHAPARMKMEAVARALGMSVRSLRRRLHEEHESYQKIEAEALGNVAKRLLQQPAMTIKEVAHHMGFVNAATFHRAFKRWTGSTPSAVREP